MACDVVNRDGACQRVAARLWAYLPSEAMPSAPNGFADKLSAVSELFSRMPAASTAMPLSLSPADTSRSAPSDEPDDLIAAPSACRVPLKHSVLRDAPSLGSE